VSWCSTSLLPALSLLVAECNAAVVVLGVLGRSSCPQRVSWCSTSLLPALSLLVAECNAAVVVLGVLARSSCPQRAELVQHQPLGPAQPPSANICSRLQMQRLPSWWSVFALPLWVVPAQAELGGRSTRGRGSRAWWTSAVAGVT
jgi:hypothetical protein